MFIKKKDYKALIADLEYLLKENHALQNYLIEEYNLRRKLDNDYKEFGVYYYKSKELRKMFVILNKINSEENEEEVDD